LIFFSKINEVNKKAAVYDNDIALLIPAAFTNTDDMFIARSFWKNGRPY